LHAVFLFAGGGELRYYDPRRFGFFFVGTRGGLAKTLNIGPDPFQMKPKTLARILHNRTAPIKSLLLDQRIISGLGNIYVDEALFRAGMHPLTPGGRAAAGAGELLGNIRAVLKRAIRHGGTTFRNYRTHDGSKGAYQRRLAVYGREGERCRRCGGRIKRIVLGGRSTHFCPRCQQRKAARHCPSKKGS
jgi:formamidopyrimidine-DNA glycosylase